MKPFRLRSAIIIARMASYVSGLALFSVAPQLMPAQTAHVTEAVRRLGGGYVFQTPYGVAVDAHGNVFVADSNGNKVEEIEAVNGVIPVSPTVRVLATSFIQPYDVAVDAAGNVFVADLNEGAVKEIVAVNGVIPASPTVNTLASGFVGPSGVAVDAHGNVFVVDNRAHKVEEIVAVGGSIPVSATIWTLGSGFNAPIRVAVDTSGNVFVTDIGDNVVKEMLAVNGTVPRSPTINTLGSGFNSPYGIAVDASGNVFIGDNGSGDVKEMLAVHGSIPSSPKIKTFVDTTGFTYPTPAGVALDAHGNIFVAHNNINQVTEIFVGAGDFGPVKVGNTSSGNIALNFTFEADETLGSTAVVTQGAPNLDFTDAGGGTCKAGKAYSAGDSCTIKAVLKPISPGARYGAAELLDGSGKLLAFGYVQGTGVGPQVTFANSTSGVYLPSLQSTPGSGFTYPFSVAVDASGNVFVGDTGNGAVKEIVADGGYTTVKTLPGVFNTPRGVAVDGAGNVFVATSSDPTVKEILAAGGYASVKTLGSGFYIPHGVAVDGSGNVFVADSNNNAVKEILAADGYNTIRTLGSGFREPLGLALDGNGNVFVADSNNYAVKEILAASGYTTVKTLASGFVSYGVAVDGGGNVFVADTEFGSVQEILAASGDATLRALATGFSAPSGVAVDGAGDVFVADWYNSRIVKLDYAAPPSLTFDPSSVGVKSSDSPQTLTLSNNGNAMLTFPVPLTGTNPTISGGFTFDAVTPQIENASSAGALAAGESLDYAVNYVPVVAGAATGSIQFTDNNLNANPAVTQTVPLSGGVAQSVFHLAFTMAPPITLQSGHAPGTVAVSVEDSSNNLVTSSSATITLTVTGPNSYSQTYTATASGGIATFSSLASLSAPGSYFYTAADTADGFTQAVASETVWASHLAFTTPPPGSLKVGNAPAAVAVGVEDLNNNLIATSTATITLTVTGPNSYSQTYTTTASSGVAAFGSLPAFSKVGKYTYTATDAADGFTQAIATETVWAPAPVGHIGSAVDNLTLSQTVGQPDSVWVRGWTADPTDGAPLGNVQVFIDGNPAGTPTLGIPRHDVVESTNNSDYLNSGYRVLYSASTLSIGTHQVTVVATNSAGQSTTFGPRQFSVAAGAGTGAPYGGIDVAGDSVTASPTIIRSGTLEVRGWLIDAKDGAPLNNVAIFIDGSSIGTPMLGLIRPDIVDAFGNNAFLRSGFKMLYPVSGLSVGAHTVTVQAIDSTGQTTTFGPRTITVFAPPPVGHIGAVVDSVTFSETVGTADSVAVTGWAADPLDGAPLGNVKVFIDGAAAGTPTLGIPRLDVAEASQNSAYLNSGYRLLSPASALSAGVHKVTVVATNSAGISTTFGPRTFTVAAAAGTGSPFGGIDEAGDSVTGSSTINQSGTLEIRGWIVDAADGAPLGSVNVAIDGTSVGVPTLGLSRPDIAAAFADNRLLHSGFRLLYPAASLAAGTHTITVTATDTAARSTTFGPRTITVQ